MNLNGSVAGNNNKLSIEKRKENLKHDDFNFMVKDGAFGFEHVTKVNIGIPFEFKGMPVEAAPVEITFMNGDKKLASGLLEPNGDRRVRLYKDEGNNVLKGRYVLSGKEIYNWNVANNQLLPINRYSSVAMQVENIAEISRAVWQKYVTGSYDKQSNLVLNRGKTANNVG